MNNFLIVIKVGNYSAIALPFSNEALEILMSAKKLKTDFDGKFIEFEESDIELRIVKNSFSNTGIDTAIDDLASR